MATKTIKTKTAAINEAARLWGRQAAVQDNGGRFRDGTPAPTTPAERAAATAELERHMETKPVEPSLKTFGDERTVGEWRAALTVYTTEKAIWQQRRSILQSAGMYRRYQVGDLSRLPGLGNCFHVRGSGDTWEEAFAAAARR